MDTLLIELKIKEISNSLFGINSKFERTSKIIDQLKLELKSVNKKEFSNYHSDLVFAIEILTSFQKDRCTIRLTDPKHVLNSVFTIKENENDKKRLSYIINLLNLVISNQKSDSGHISSKNL